MLGIDVSIAQLSTMSWTRTLKQRSRWKWSASRLGRYNPGERAPATHWIGDLVGPRAGLNAVVKRKNPSGYKNIVEETKKHKRKLVE